MLAMGRELDQRTVSGDCDITGDGVLSWVCKVAPAAQGGYAAVSKAVGPPCAKLPFLHDEAPGGWPDQQAMATDRFEVTPAVVAMLRGMIVVYKPVHWEVDGLTSEVGCVRSLSSFVQSVLPRSDSILVHTAELDYGFIHRLDVPSSGLILGGTNFEGLFQLKWQIAVYAIDRQYLTANHGHLDRSSLVIDRRIDATTAETMRSITNDAGKPAKTRLGLFAHLSFTQPGAMTQPSSLAQPSTSDVDFCIFVISIHTGRRHQIRVHTRHVGHPCATDARYAPHTVTLG